MTDNRKKTKQTADTPAALPAALPRLLLEWYDHAARVLPWRKDHDPYHIWVSEIMLQQTGVEFVINYYVRFLEAFPTVKALASADEQEVLKLWEGLGYYTRAKNLKKAAEIIIRVYGGYFPETYKDILKLPGIGPYTAGAIASICFEQPVPAVDGNVERVISRIAGLYTAEKNILKKQVTVMLSDIYPDKRRGDLTQSLMELGALVCVPNGAAKCGNCPVSEHCMALKTDAVSLLPVRQNKPVKKRIKITVFLLVCGENLAIRHRNKGGLLSGLWELPNVEGHLTENTALETAAYWGTRPSAVGGFIRRKHVFTHIIWDILCYTVQCAEQPPGFTWTDRRSLADLYPIPTAFRKLL